MRHLRYLNMRSILEKFTRNLWSAYLIGQQSGSQSLRSPWPADGKRELWEQPFRNNRILPIRFHCAVSYFLQTGYIYGARLKNGCSQSSRFPTAGQGERRLWERDRLGSKVLHAWQIVISGTSISHASFWYGYDGTFARLEHNTRYERTVQRVAREL